MDRSLSNDSELMRLARGAMGLRYDCHGTANTIAEKLQSVRHVDFGNNRDGYCHSTGKLPQNLHRGMVTLKNQEVESINTQLFQRNALVLMYHTLQHHARRHLRQL